MLIPVDRAIFLQGLLMADSLLPSDVARRALWILALLGGFEVTPFNLGSFLPQSNSCLGSKPCQNLPSRWCPSHGAKSSLLGLPLCVLERESGGLTAETAPHATQRTDTSLHSHLSHGRSHTSTPAQDKKKQHSNAQHTCAKTDPKPSGIE